MSAPLLVVEGLRAGYGHVEVLHGISLAVPKGSIVTVIGANGAGKTTLLNALIGLMPARGTIRFDGAAVDGQPLEARIGRGMGLVPERRELFADMSVEDNLQIGGFRRGRVERAETFETVLGRFPRLRERRHQLAGTLSGGERQMLAMGRALMARPQLLMLDEPSLGLAPRIIAQVFEILVELRAAGVVDPADRAERALGAEDRRPCLCA